MVSSAVGTVSRSGTTVNQTPRVGAGRDVEIVEALERRGDNLQPRTCRQKHRVHLVRHERHDRIRRRGTPQNLLARQRVRRLVGNGSQCGARNSSTSSCTRWREDDARHRAAVYLNLRRRWPLNPSTTVTMTRITSMIALTSRYCMMRSDTHQLESDAAGADHAHHGRGAEIVFPAVDRYVGELRQHLRQHGVEEHLQRRCAGCARGFDRRLVDVFDRLGKELCPPCRPSAARAPARPAARRSRPRRRR